MNAALSIIMTMCLNAGNDYHLCHEEYVQCAKEISDQNGINLFEAVKWCDSYAKEIDRKLFETRVINAADLVFPEAPESSTATPGSPPGTQRKESNETY